MDSLIAADQTEGLLTILEELTLEEKVALVQGADFWSTVAIPRVGLRSMVLSDGPAGVRGPKWDERDPSLSLPSGTAMASSWDVGLARRYGEASASEARRKGVDVVLGPTINLHRSPLGGRHFECLSEDPWLSAELGVAYIGGLQDNGVAATPKHYVANDSETERFTVDVRVSDRAMRELYLLPFERAVEAGAWSVMSSYNSVDGVTMSENDLLETPLNSEWGFDGVVISDWTAVRSLGSVPAAQDLAMPGPAPAWSGLADAISAGEIPVEALDRKVLRMLRLAERVGALGAPDAAPAVSEALPALDGPAFAREAAIAGMVLLKNDGELPWAADSLERVAVIGHNASQARFQGGGSATVLPEKVTTPLDAIHAALPGARVDYELGAVVQEGIAELPLEWMSNPCTGQPGLTVTFRGSGGEVLQSDDRRSTALVWFDGDAPFEDAASLELHTILTPHETRTVHLGFGSHLHGMVEVNGVTVLDRHGSVANPQLGASFSFPPMATALVELTADVPVELRVHFDLASGRSPLANALGLTVGTAPDPGADADELIERAAQAARAADVAVVVVGTNSSVESEGRDRTHLRLPGRQDDLVAAVAAANPRTVVVVNSGAPVLLPWRDDVKAVLLGWFGGQELGQAVADVLLGEAEPGGRLTTSWPAATDDVPVLEVVPTAGCLDYTEGIHIGYRAWLRTGRTPAYAFGHGLGYTDWTFESLEVTGTEQPDLPGDVTARIRLRNTGARAGKQVVQLYAERPISGIERPERWLVGFAVVHAEPGQSLTVDIPVAGRRLAHWDDGWELEPGSFVLRAGASVADLSVAGTLFVPDSAGVEFNVTGKTAQ
ncbi:glycoside hydrolase family 3 C-terminal domain-containing protein [Arthrobacter sp. NPDC093128]|uniref:beta-glucosidase family protein n=1 Tax=Arthrobacter sp. NPDC093128 TaxID=3154979 RepID=UPI0034351D16